MAGKPPKKKTSRKKDIVLVALLAAIVIILLLPWIGTEYAAAKRRNALENALNSMGERQTVSFASGNNIVHFVNQQGVIVMDVPLEQMGIEQQENFLQAYADIGVTNYIRSSSFMLEFLAAEDAVEETDYLFQNIFGMSNHYEATISINVEGKPCSWVEGRVVCSQESSGEK